MFGNTTLQKTLNGLSCFLMLLMLVFALLFTFGVLGNERYDYKISKSELGLKFGYHIEPSLKEYIIPKVGFSLELDKNGITVPEFFETASAKLALVYDDDTNEFLYLSASLVHGKQFDKGDLNGLYAVFERSVDEFVGLSR